MWDCGDKFNKIWTIPLFINQLQAREYPRGPTDHTRVINVSTCEVSIFTYVLPAAS